jgi:hypothetical protein
MALHQFTGILFLRQAAHAMAVTIKNPAEAGFESSHFLLIKG